MGANTDSKRQIRLNPDTLMFVAGPDLSVTPTPLSYGATITDPDNPEWEMTAFLSPGQGGSTAWVVVLMSVDMGCEVTQGKCRTNNIADAIEDAIRHLTAKWLPHHRINA